MAAATVMNGSTVIGGDRSAPIPAELAGCRTDLTHQPLGLGAVRAWVGVKRRGVMSDERAASWEGRGT
jgi:hypothetical protein